jgi:hypothetical protein
MRTHASPNPDAPPVTTALVSFRFTVSPFFPFYRLMILLAHGEMLLQAVSRPSPAIAMGHIERFNNLANCTRESCTTFKVRIPLF